MTYFSSYCVFKSGIVNSRQDRLFFIGLFLMSKDNLDKSKPYKRFKVTRNCVVIVVFVELDKVLHFT